MSEWPNIDVSERHSWHVDVSEGELENVHSGEELRRLVGEKLLLLKRNMLLDLCERLEARDE